MTVTSALVAVVTRKVRALIAEVRSLVNSARELEKAKVATAEYEILVVRRTLANDVAAVRNELITRINNL